MSHFRLPRRITAPVTLLRVVAMLVIAVGVLSFGSIGTAASQSLVINEVDYDQPSTYRAQFFELKNVSGAAINLDAYRVELINGSNAQLYQVYDLPNVNLAAGDYFVVCGNAANTANCDMDVTPDTDLIQNGAPDGLRLDARPRPGAGGRRQLRGRHGRSDGGQRRRSHRHRSRRARGRREHLALPRRCRRRRQQRRLLPSHELARRRERLRRSEGGHQRGRLRPARHRHCRVPRAQEHVCRRGQPRSVRRRARERHRRRRLRHDQPPGRQPRRRRLLRDLRGRDDDGELRPRCHTRLEPDPEWLTRRPEAAARRHDLVDVLSYEGDTAGATQGSGHRPRGPGRRRPLSLSPTATRSMPTTSTSRCGPSRPARPIRARRRRSSSTRSTTTRSGPTQPSSSSSRTRLPWRSTSIRTSSSS